ncbi:MAG: Uma2 family endonuclease [Defluviitaleaceae bacterium]|nr:Uma2 family endonuclease [Defluviitaleaceae bacterium]
MEARNLALNKKYTYDDYASWDNDTRWELIDGAPYAMGSPTSDHQSISMSLGSQFYNHLKGKTCRVFAAALDVRLNFDKGDDTVVQPDIVVICDRNKIDKRSCLGAPDLVVEILSPATARIDKVKKFNKYMEAGVKEYWVVDPDTSSVQVHVLKEKYYVTNAYDDTDTVSVSVLPGCEINLAEVFNEINEINET